MWSTRAIVAYSVAVMALILFGAPVAGQLTSSANYSLCINQTIERITCPGNQSMMYMVGDMATGAIPNCGMPFYQQANLSKRPTVKLLHPNIVITNTTLIPLAARISGWMKYPLGVDVIDSALWTKEPLREFSERPEGTREAWFLDPVLTADMADEPVSGLLDLSQLVLQDRNLNWAGYGTFFRRFASVYDGKVVGLPVSAAIMLLYYRRDFFESRGLPVPATWEEVVDLAERYNGTDLGGSSRSAWGFCMSRQPVCYNGYTFQSLQVPFMQTEGTSQGFHFDPDTMQPLVNSTGTRRAAELYRRLSRYTAPTEAVACLPVSLAFVAGNCLMAVGTTLHFKYAQFNNSLNNITRVRGKTGTAVLPGSFEVLNRTSGRMERCNQNNCPYGRWHTLENGTRTWVNAAPFAGRGAFTYALNRHRDPHLQYMAYRLCARRVYADAMWPSVLSATAETTPVRSEMVDPANVDRYTAAGYDRADTLLFMKALSETMEHQNIALNLRIFGALEYYYAVDAASVALSDTNRDIDEILAEAQRNVTRLYGNVSTEWLKQRYWKSIDRKLPTPTAPASRGGMDARTRTGLGVGVGLGGGLLVLGLVALVGVLLLWPAFLSARQRKAYVPSASSICTLVVTDMESSTDMWEAFPGDVMATALQMHDGIARKVLARHRGYESATEGDSFIIAFPDALAALKFAVEFQTELMAADWPAVLLQDSDLCRPVYATPRTAKDKEGQPLFRRSGPLRPPATPRLLAQPPAPPAAGAGSGFSHISGVVAALAASTGATTTSKTRGGGAPPSRALQQPPSVGLAQLQEGQASQGGGLVGLGTSLSEIPEKDVDNQGSLGSLGSLGGVGRLPSGLFRKPSFQASTSGGSSIAAAQQRLLAQHSSRVSPLSIPPRAYAAGGDGCSASPAELSLALQAAAAADAAGPAGAREPLQPPPHAAKQSLLSRPSRGDTVSSALMTAEDELRNSAPANTVGWSTMMVTGTAPQESAAAPGAQTADADASETPSGTPPAAPAAAEIKLGSAATAARAALTESVTVSGEGCWPWGSEAGDGWQLLEGPAPGAVTVFRGLRIRIGLFAGVRAHELTRTRASARISFCGLAIRMAKAVSDAANGGMVVVSDTAALQLLGVPEVAALLASEGTEMWHLGRMELAEDLRPVELFQVVSPTLAPRLALQQPLRIKSQLLPGVLSAPAGCVALVRLHVSGLATLRSTHPELAGEVGGVLEALLLQSLPALGGYLSEARHGGADGITVAFPDCLRAVAWALAVQADMKGWDWSAELLQHEAFETIAVDTSLASSFTNYSLCSELAAVRGSDAAFGGAAKGAEAFASAARRNSRSKVQCAPSVTSVGALTPRTMSFTSATGRPQPPAAAISGKAIAGGISGGSFTHPNRQPSGTAGGGGVSFSSQTDRPHASGGSRLSAIAGSFTASFIFRSQRYLLRGPASRMLAIDVEGPDPSLLSPLQAPPDLPTEPKTHGPLQIGSAAATAGESKPPARRVSLHGRWRLGRQAQDDEEEGGAMRIGAGDLESGRAEAVRPSPTRPSPARETLRLVAALAPAAADVADVSIVEAAAMPVRDRSIGEDRTSGGGFARTDGGSTAAPVAEAAGDGGEEPDPATAAPGTGSIGGAAAADDGTEVQSWHAVPNWAAVPPAAGDPGAASVAAAMGPSAGAAEMSRPSAGSGRYMEPSSAVTSCATNVITAVNVGGQVLFRGPRTKVVVDYGVVSTEVCRATGRLLYRGRTAKQLTKLMAAAQRGQVLCTAAVFAQAGKAAPQVGISIAPVASAAATSTQAPGGGGGGGRRKPPGASSSRTGPGAFARPPSITLTGSAVGLAATAGGGGSIAGSAAPGTIDPQEAGAAVGGGAAATKKAQYYLCTLTQPRVGVTAAAAQPPAVRGDSKVAAAVGR